MCECPVKNNALYPDFTWTHNNYQDVLQANEWLALPLNFSMFNHMQEAY